VTSSRTAIGIVVLFLGLGGLAHAVEHWEPIGPSYDPGYPTVDPPFAVSESGYFVTNYSGVWQSPDGKNWARTGRGLFFLTAFPVSPPAGVRAFALDASSPSTMYAGTSGGGVYKSINAGGTWSPANTGLTNSVVQVLAAVPGSPGTLYAGTLGAVFKTVDGAASWTRIDNGLANMNITSLAVDLSAHSTVYAGTWNAGVFKSTNAGTTWVQTTLRTEGEPGTPGIYALAVDPSRPGVVYAGAYHHTFRSDDAGATWTALTGRSGDGGAISIAIDPLSPSTLYVTDVNGFYRSDDRGLTWSQLRGLGGSVAVDPRSDAVYRSSKDSGFARSRDRGETWEMLTNGPLSYPIFRVTAGRSRSTIYALAFETNYAQCPDGCSPLSRTDDEGVTWRDVTPTGLTGGLLDATEIAVDPTSDSVLYAGRAGLLKSTDGGQTWARSEAGLPADSTVFSIAVDPNVPSTAYAGTSAGLFRSQDAGAHWVATTVSGSVTAVAVDPSNPSLVYAGTLPTGLYRSSDRGGSWTPFVDGLTGEPVLSLAIDPSDSNVYAATRDSEAFRTNRSGTWESISEGLPPGFTVRSFAFDSSLGAVYAGLDSDRVFVTTTGRIFWSEIIAPVGGGFQLATNPMRPGTLFVAGELGLFEGTIDSSQRRRPRLVPFR
jgi:photosystem II stability/assembly factor-like uncharacterized protein